MTAIQISFNNSQYSSLSLTKASTCITHHLIGMTNAQRTPNHLHYNNVTTHMHYTHGKESIIPNDLCMIFRLSRAKYVTLSRLLNSSHVMCTTLGPIHT